MGLASCSHLETDGLDLALLGPYIPSLRHILSPAHHFLHLLYPSSFLLLLQLQDNLLNGLALALALLINIPKLFAALLEVSFLVRIDGHSQRLIGLRQCYVEMDVCHSCMYGYMQLLPF